MNRKKIHKLISDYVPLVCGGIAFVFGLVTLWGGAHLPLMARGASVGVTASSLAALAVLVVYPIERTRIQRSSALSWRSERVFTRMQFDLIILSVAHALLALLLCSAAFAVFQMGFVGLTLDPLAGAVLIMLAVLVAGALAHHSASLTTAVHYTDVLIVLVVTGSIGAMLITNDSGWWQSDFSELAGLGNIGSLVMNLTLIFAGAGVVVLGDYISHDLAVAVGRLRPRGVYLVRWLLGVAGVLMVLVGAVPVSVNRPIHVFFAMAMTATVVVLMIIAPLRVFSVGRGFRWASWSAVGAIAVAVFLSRIVGYFTWTAAEVVSATVIFCWLSVFVRRLAERPADDPDADPDDPAAAEPRTDRAAAAVAAHPNSVGSAGSIGVPTPSR